MKNQSQFANKAITELLRDIASAYLLKGENRFKIIAYENAATAVEHATRELRDLWQEGKLRIIPGIGPSIAAHLDELFTKGSAKHFDEVLKDIPPSVFRLMKVPGIGPKKAYKLVIAFKFFNVETIFEDVVHAAQEGRIATLETFGEKSQTDILEAIERYRKNSHHEERMPLPYAYKMAQHIIQYLKKHPMVKRADALGSLRRMVPTIGDIDIAVQTKIKNKNENIKNGEQEIISYFIAYPDKIAVDNAGDKKASIIIPPNIRVDLRIQNEESYGSMLQYFTGSKGHNIKLREYALKKGLSLSEWGIKEVQNNKDKVKSKNVEKEDSIKEFKTEEAFYQFLGVPYIPPEIREGTNEIDLALKNKLPKLVEVKDIKGDFHIHSSYDLHPSHDFGANTYLEIAQKGYELGYEYVGFADHNPKITGVSEDEIIAIMKTRKQHIDKVFSTPHAKCSKYFIGLETDILPSGELALPKEAIEYVDYLIVSVHSSFNMDIKAMTKRVLKAMSYPKVKILGHPTGRLLGKREGFELDWEQIFSHAAQHTIALEINSWPQRLDLPDSLVREGKAAGVKFFINTDAHANSHMDNMLYGVSVARRGWLEKADVVNTGSVKKIMEWFSQ
jgi:DNA polymerase (family X)